MLHINGQKEKEGGGGTSTNSEPTVQPNLTSLFWTWALAAEFEVCKKAALKRTETGEKKHKKKPATRTAGGQQDSTRWLVRLGFGSCPLDHGLWRAVEEDQFGVEILLQTEFLHLAHQVDVQAELQDIVHHWQLAEDDGQVLASGGHTQKAANQEDEGHVQADDAV